MKNFLESVREKAEQLAIAQDLVLYSVDLVKSSTGRVLRVNLDGDVTLDKCALISRNISDWIDKLPENLVPGYNYSLEVSSLGLDRPLKTAEDFQSNLGKLCRVRCVNADDDGRRNYKGFIKKVEKGSVIIFSKDDNADYSISINNIKKANLDIEF